MGAIALVLVSTTVAWAGEATVPEREVPQKAMAAVRQAHPGMKVLRCEKDGSRYEVSIEVGSRQIDVEVEAAGTLLGEEEKISLEDVPAVVRHSFESLPAGKWRLIQVEKVTHPGSDLASYEFEVTDGHRRQELLFNHKGERLESS